MKTSGNSTHEVISNWHLSDVAHYFQCWLIFHCATFMISIFLFLHQCFLICGNIVLASAAHVVTYSVNVSSRQAASLGNLAKISTAN